jgi:hypothetical protein
MRLLIASGPSQGHDNSAVPAVVTCPFLEYDVSHLHMNNAAAASAGVASFHNDTNLLSLIGS